ncbi:hypothetical protein D9M71_730460 [compost metagenome]
MISVNRRSPYCILNLTSRRFMQALVMTKTMGSQEASVVVTPREPASSGILAVTAALPRLPVRATRTPTQA